MCGPSSAFPPLCPERPQRPNATQAGHRAAPDAGPPAAAPSSRLPSSGRPRWNSRSRYRRPRSRSSSSRRLAQRPRGARADGPPISAGVQTIRNTAVLCEWANGMTQIHPSVGPSVQKPPPTQTCAQTSIPKLLFVQASFILHPKNRKIPTLVGLIARYFLCSIFAPPPLSNN